MFDNRYSHESVIIDFSKFIKDADLTTVNNQMSCLNYINTYYYKRPLNGPWINNDFNKIIEELRIKLPLSLIK